MGLDPYGGFQMVNGQMCILLLHVIKDKKLWIYTPSLNFKIHKGSDYVIYQWYPGEKGSKYIQWTNKMKMKLEFATHLSLLIMLLLVGTKYGLLRW